MLTEQQNPRTAGIDRADTRDMLRAINDEDKQIAFVVEAALPQVARAVDAAAVRLRAGGRLIYIGAGTSGRLGVLDAVECVPTFGTSPETVQGIIAGGQRAITSSIENVEDDEGAAVTDLKKIALNDRDLLVGIAASGTTPYVLSGVRYGRSIGVLTVGISCNVPAPLLDAAEIGIALPVGPEVITGSTRMKAGTAQKMVLNMISTATMVQLGKVYGNLMVDVQMTNEKLVRRAQGIVMQITGVDSERAAELLRQADKSVKTAVVVGRLNISADEAQARLADAKGRLREVIGD